MKAPILLTLAALLSSTAHAADIHGFLLERGTKTPLVGVNLFVLPHKLKATTGADGAFTVTGVPDGPFSWVINSSGYKRAEIADANVNGEDRELYLERTSYQIFETTVYGKGNQRDQATRTLKASEIEKLPGSGGDPIKAVQNLPGVNRAPGISSQVIIQGSAPQDTRYHIDGHEVPLIFHFGGLSSVIQPEALDRIDFLSAGYGVEHGRANGGLVGAWTKTPAKDRIKGFGFIDTFNSGLAIEGPIGEHSQFYLGARKSYIGEVLAAAFKDNEDFNLTVAPSYRDAVGIFAWQPSDRDEVKVVLVGSQDALEFLFKEPAGSDPAIRGGFSNRTSFVRLIPQWTHKHGEATVSRWSLGLGRDWISVDVGSDFFRLSTYSATARGELEHRFSDEWISQWGIDSRFTWAEVGLSFRNFYSSGGVGNPYSSGDYRRLSIDDQHTLLGAYWRNELKPAGTPWTLIPGLRAEYYSKTKEVIPLPRVAARYALSDSVQLKAATGLYAQPPQEQETDPTIGNAAINAPRAAHFALGADKDFREGTGRGFLLSGGGFYRQFYDLVVPSTAYVSRGGTLVPENYSNEGRGRSFGLEALLKMELAPWTGFLSYTVSRSTRWNRGEDPRLFAYDQTHLLTAIGAVDLGRNWTLGARVRFVTGNPNTPVVGGTYDADNDTYVPIRGGIYSSRLDAFYQIDLRADKKWIFPRWMLSLYLDIQNLTNRKNVEAIQYSYNYNSSQNVSGLPILPTFGLKAEF